MTPELERPDYTCTCIALNHDHTSNKCDRKGTYAGGVCVECRYHPYGKKYVKKP